MGPVAAGPPGAARSPRPAAGLSRRVAEARGLRPHRRTPGRSRLRRPLAFAGSGRPAPKTPTVDHAAPPRCRPAGRRRLPDRSRCRPASAGYADRRPCRAPARVAAARPPVASLAAWLAGRPATVRSRCRPASAGYADRRPCRPPALPPARLANRWRVHGGGGRGRGGRLLDGSGERGRGCLARGGRGACRSAGRRRVGARECVACAGRNACRSAGRRAARSAESGRGVRLVGGSAEAAMSAVWAVFFMRPTLGPPSDSFGD